MHGQDSRVANTRSPAEVDRIVGVRLRDLRLRKGLSQNALADLIGISYQQLQKYELGRNRIAASRLFAAACVLDVPIHVFFEDAPPSPNGDGRLPELSPEHQELDTLFSAITDRRLRRGVIAMIRKIAAG